MNFSLTIKDLLMMNETQTLEILDVLKNLPSEKVNEVKDFAMFLRERYGENEQNNIVDESDEWSDNDLQDVSLSSISYADGEGE